MKAGKDEVMEEQPFINTPEYLAELVVDARRTRGWTQQELAGMSSVGLSFVTDLESGVERIEVDQVNRVLKALGMVPRALPVRPAWAYDTDGRLKEEFRGRS